MKRALAIFSGGLDSLLAVLMVRQQGIQVDGVYFETPFFPSNRAQESARQIGLNLKIVNITEEMLDIIKNPRFGWGSGLNPCLDCHLLMCQKACEIMRQEGYHFLVSGEVLGQRPLSQTKQAMLKIQKECVCGKYLLRPLSAKLLPPTIAEDKGWVDRNKLLGLKGRSRKPQMALAKQLGLKEYPSPAGGCLLTDKEFSQRLADLFKFQKKIEVRDLELLKIGRHFRINPQTKVIVGRNEAENKRLKTLFIPEKDSLIKATTYPGPLIIIPYGGDKEGLKMAASICASYSDAPKNQPIETVICQRQKLSSLKVISLPKKVFRPFLIVHHSK